VSVHAEPDQDTGSKVKTRVLYKSDERPNTGSEPSLEELAKTCIDDVEWEVDGKSQPFGMGMASFFQDAQAMTPNRSPSLFKDENFFLVK